jgi:hypothetical protein
MSQRQEQGLAALGQLFEEQSDKLDALLDEVQALAARTHAAVLDVQQELLNQGLNNRALYQAVLDLQRRFDLMHAEVRPRDSLSIHTDEERQLVREVVASYRRLPVEERKRLPASLTELSMSRMSLVSLRWRWAWSIHRPERSTKCLRFSLVERVSVSKRAISLAEAAVLSLARPPTTVRSANLMPKAESHLGNVG